MNRIREYNLLFTKMSLSNRIGVIWYLIFPLAAFFSYNASWFTVQPSAGEFYFQTSFFLSYIIFAMSIEVVTTLISMRENGFLKVFTFVSGSKHSIIAGKVSNQLIFILLAALIFSICTSIIMLQDLTEIALFTLAETLSALLGALSLILFFLVFMLLPIKQESLVTVMNILLFVLFFISAKNFSHAFSWGIVLLYINPLELVRSLTLWVGEFITGERALDNFAPKLIALGIIAYVIIGLVSLRYIKTNSAANRT